MACLFATSYKRMSLLDFSLSQALRSCCQRVSDSHVAAGKFCVWAMPGAVSMGVCVGQSRGNTRLVLYSNVFLHSAHVSMGSARVQSRVNVRRVAAQVVTVWSSACCLASPRITLDQTPTFLRILSNFRQKCREYAQLDFILTLSCC